MQVAEPKTGVVGAHDCSVASAAAVGRLLPRRITKNVLWTGGCIELTLQGETVHSHFANYVVRGEERVLMIDTGHPIHAEAIESAIDEFLEGRVVDYIFPTHGEFPHFGLLPRWMRKFPEAVVVGEVRDYPLYYPEEAHRFRMLEVGEPLDLGGRKFFPVPAVWCDLKDTLWGFDTGDRMLFVADGFALTHHHPPNHCGLTAGEMPIPDTKMLQMVTEITLQWTRYTDTRQTFSSLDSLLKALQPKFIAPAHGPVIDCLERMMPVIKAGMEVMPTLAPKGAL